MPFPLVTSADDFAVYTAVDRAGFIANDDRAKFITAVGTNSTVDDRSNSTAGVYRAAFYYTGSGLVSSVPSA